MPVHVLYYDTVDPGPKRPELLLKILESIPYYHELDGSSLPAYSMTPTNAGAELFRLVATFWVDVGSPNMLHVVFPEKLAIFPNINAIVGRDLYVAGTSFTSCGERVSVVEGSSMGAAVDGMVHMEFIFSSEFNWVDKTDHLPKDIQIRRLIQ